MTREEAIQVLEEEAEYLYQDDRPYNREAFDMAIKALQAEAVHGKWLDVDKEIVDSSVTGKVFVCSECGFCIEGLTTNAIADFKEKFNFCVCCGAKMDKE